MSGATPSTSARAPVPDPDLEAGLAAFAARDVEAAHAAFERAYRRDTRAPRAMSWYGVTLVLVERNSNLGVALCDGAARLAPAPETLLNVARVALALAQRERSVRAISRGLELWPRDPGLLAACAALGTRSAPVLPFLPRGNVLNRTLGKLRHRWRRRGAPDQELSPVSLGLPAGAPEP